MLRSWYSRACQALFVFWYHWSQNEACLLCVQGFAFLWMWVIADANIYLLEKKRQNIFEMNACGALAAASVRVLGRYLGLKYIRGGGERPRAAGGDSAKRNSRADKCLKCWQNVICWHLTTEETRCFKHDRVAFTIFVTSAKEGGKSD